MIILFVLSIFYYVYTEPVQICGNNYVGVGYDYLTASFKQPIFTKTFLFNDTEHTWKNPFYPGDVEYIPQELYLTNTPETFTFEGSFVHHILDNYTREYSYHHSDSGLFTKHTTDIYYYIHRTLVFDNSKGFYYKRIAWYTLELEPIILFDPEPYLDPFFKKAVANLPNDIGTAENQLIYRQFIQTYGTSYMRRAVMGGELQLSLWMHNCFLDEQSIYWIKEQSSFCFLGIVAWGHTREHYIKKIDTTFLSHVEMDSTALGGNWRNITWEVFKNTLKGDLLQPIYYSFDPITDLIPDKTKKSNMVQMIKSYAKFQDEQYNAVVEDAKKQPKHPKPSWCSGL